MDQFQALEGMSEQSNLHLNLLEKKAVNPIWLSVSEAAKFGGVNNKTIRRAIQSKSIRYKVIKNRYFIDLASVIVFMQSSIKLKNKFASFGFGQYVDKWLEH